MTVKHKKCNGIIVRGRCTKCKKRFWNPKYWFSLKEVTYLTSKEEVEFKLRKVQGRQTTTHAKWGDKLPGVGSVASLLPNWPRWARILTTLVLATGIVFLVILVI